MLYALILACEAAFWLFLFAGLSCRYVFQAKGLSAFLLLCVPLLDLALLAFAALDLHKGARASFGHGLATVYIGFTVAFGPTLITWADRRFAHHFQSAPLPQPAPMHGWPALRYELSLWALCLAALSISCLLIALLVSILPPTAPTQLLRAWIAINASTAAFWFLFGPLPPLCATLVQYTRKRQRRYQFPE